MYIQVDANGADAAAALSRVAGVTRVVESDRRDSLVGYEVMSESGRDVRRELANTVVTQRLGPGRAPARRASASRKSS